MLANGATGTGISAHKRANDLGDFADELDMIEGLGVEAIELPTYDMDIVIGGKIRRQQLEALKRACAGRDVVYSVHGPLSINFMDEAWRLPRHMEVLEASLEVAAEVGAEHYVIHSGLVPQQQAQGIEAACANGSRAPATLPPGSTLFCAWKPCLPVMRGALARLRLLASPPNLQPSTGRMCWRRSTSAMPI